MCVCRPNVGMPMCVCVYAVSVCTRTRIRRKHLALYMRTCVVWCMGVCSVVYGCVQCVDAFLHTPAQEGSTGHPAPALQATRAWEGGARAKWGATAQDATPLFKFSNSAPQSLYMVYDERVEVSRTYRQSGKQQLRMRRNCKNSEIQLHGHFIRYIHGLESL